MKTELENQSDMAELIFAGSIPDGERSRDVEIKATDSGLLIDEFIVVPWDWIHRAEEYLKSIHPDMPAPL